jgi:hypothetical protein
MLPEYEPFAEALLGNMVLAETLQEAIRIQSNSESGWADENCHIF